MKTPYSKRFSFTERLRFFLIRMLGALLLLTLGATWRLRFRGVAFERSVRSRGLRPIYAFWHGRLLAILRTMHFPLQLIIAQVTNQLGFGSVRGSTTRGGIRALRALGRKLLGGFDVAITPDGPRGPRHILQAGAIYIAMRTGHPLVPITSTGLPRWTFGSWDRFIIPKPFADVLVRLGEPFYVPPDLNEKQREEYRLRFEKQMIELVETADREVAERNKTD